MTLLLRSTLVYVIYLMKFLRREIGVLQVLPLEVEIPSLRVIMEAKLSEAEWCQGRYDQLNLIEERRLNALARGRCHTLILDLKNTHSNFLLFSKSFQIHHVFYYASTAYITASVF